ncbi:hypothetical protein [Saccharicrinis sp. GN24d3]|uniref:hypothetical protein n=1 Tax=Saccharicrinis sp. GN24d3 TaxID=3458416 RepID=UPI0040358ACD
MMPQIQTSWQDSFTQNEAGYLSELLIEMNAFFSKPENLMSGFDITQAIANKGKNVNFGFVLEASIEMGFVQFQYDRLKLTLLGFQTACIGDKEEVADVIISTICSDEAISTVDDVDTPH